MSMFKAEKFIPITVADYKPVAEELADHFKHRNYQVEFSQLPGGEWQVGVTRGGVFKAAVGLKSALKIQIEARPSGTMVRAGAGIFGKQAVPTAITMLVAWPVIFAQAWGLIREAGLDDEAVRVVEISLTRAQRAGDHFPADSGVSSSAADRAGPDTARSGARSTAPASAFCTSCGERMDESARFCPGCGQARAS